MAINKRSYATVEKFNAATQSQFKINKQEAWNVNAASPEDANPSLVYFKLPDLASGLSVDRVLHSSNFTNCKANQVYSNNFSDCQSTGMKKSIAGESLLLEHGQQTVMETESSGLNDSSARSILLEENCDEE